MPTPDSNLSDLLARVEKIITNISDEEYTHGDIDSDFLANGTIDSFNFMTLIVELEDEFAITITEEDQLDQRLRSVTGLIELIREKRHE